MAENLNQTQDQPNPTTRRHTVSLALPRLVDPTSLPPIARGPHITEENSRADRLSRSSRRFSISPWWSHPKPSPSTDLDGLDPPGLANNVKKKKGGMWNWKPVRALSHIGMRHVSCLFSVEVVTLRSLPATVNGLRLAVSLKKEGSRDGAVQTVPSRVLHGCTDFDETLFIRCNIYFTGGPDNGKPIKFESRNFVISVVAVDAPELDFGRNTVDLSSLVLESIEKSFEGHRLRQWEKVFKLYGKVKGGELVLKLGFQIIEDGVGLGIYSKGHHVEEGTVARAQTKSSFSLTSPRVGQSESDETHLRFDSARIFKETDGYGYSVPKSDEDAISDEFDLPEFEVIEKGVEPNKLEVKRNDATRAGPISGEVVKEVVHFRAHRDMLMELDSIAKEIKALESVMLGYGKDQSKMSQRNQIQQLYAEEETVTREFLQMLEPKLESLTPRSEQIESATMALLPDLGKGLGPVIQTREGGFLISMNPLDLEVERGDIPKLAMQISKPFVLDCEKLISGFEVFQRIATIGSENLVNKLFSWADMDEIIGKTAEQIAFEGIASSIISGRNREGADSSATRSIQIVKKMSKSMVEGRKERILSGILNVLDKDPKEIEEIVAFCLQKMEAMSIDALKIQAGITEEAAPFDLSPLAEKNGAKCLFDSVVSPEDWAKCLSDVSGVTVLVGLQLRDPSRRYEIVGAPMVAVVQAKKVSNGEEESKFRVANLHVGGLQWRLGEKQRLTALQWLIAYGLAERRNNKQLQTKGRENLVWSLSSRVMADMWLKTTRNPDVRVLD